MPINPLYFTLQFTPFLLRLLNFLGECDLINLALEEFLLLSLILIDESVVFLLELRVFHLENLSLIIIILYFPLQLVLTLHECLVFIAQLLKSEMYLLHLQVFLLLLFELVVFLLKLKDLFLHLKDQYLKSIGLLEGLKGVINVSLLRIATFTAVLLGLDLLFQEF